MEEAIYRWQNEKGYGGVHHHPHHRNIQLPHILYYSMPVRHPSTSAFFSLNSHAFCFSFSSDWRDIDPKPDADVAYPLPELTQMYCPDNQYSPMGSLFFTQPDVALRTMFNRRRGIFELWSLALFGGTCCPLFLGITFFKHSLIIRILLRVGSFLSWYHCSCRIVHSHDACGCCCGQICG